MSLRRMRSGGMHAESELDFLHVRNLLIFRKLQKLKSSKKGEHTVKNLRVSLVSL